MQYDNLLIFYAKFARTADAVATFPPERIPWEELSFPSTRAALRDYLAGVEKESL